MDVDFLIDCSGFSSGILKRDASNVFHSFSDELLCDTAIFARTQQEESLPPYTLAVGMNAGWRWKIPLQNMFGNGYVFSRRFLSVEDAKREFSEKTGILEDNMKTIPFRPGYFEKQWYDNTL